MSTSIDEPIDDTAIALARAASSSSDASVERIPRRTTVRYRALAWLATAAGLAYFCRNATGVPESAIRTELGLSFEQSGWLLSAFFWSYAIFQVPSGWFAERVGSRIALSISVFAWSIAMLGMGLAPGFWLLIAAQATMGIAQAGLMPAAVNSIGRWMPLAQRSAACGILGAGMQVGAVASSGLAGALIDPLGWRLVFIAFAVPGILWTFGFFARFRDDPAEVLPSDSPELELIRAGRNIEDVKAQNDVGEARALLAIMRNPTMWWLCGQQICRSAGYQFFPTWFPTFLQQTHHVSAKTSAYLQGTVFAGVLLGCVFGGFVTDWVWRRTGSLRVSRGGVGAASLIICAVTFISAWFIESTAAAIGLLAIGNFCAAFAGPSAFAATIDIGGRRVPQAAGLMNMVGNLSAAACPVLVARLFQSTTNWNLILPVFAGIFFAGAVCWLFVNPHRPIQYAESRART
jgi:MFS transporter, ACS family, D-galactonate transporter